MLAKLSRRLTSFFVKQNSVKEEERETYNYCFEIMLATIINLLAIIIVGFSTGKYIETLIFVVIFMLLRGCVGGYHANSHFRCYIGIMTIFGVFIGLLHLNNVILKYMSITFIILAVITLLFLSPVESVNKGISDKQCFKLRKKLILLTIFFTICYLILICYSTTIIYAFCISYTMFMVSMLACAGKIKNKCLQKR